MIQMDSYNQLSVNYDLLQPRDEILKQEPFFRRLIEKYSIKTCLDCACGTGWHLHMLNGLGLQCHGSDISDTMLEKASRNLEGLAINLMNENYRTLSRSWASKYDMIICMSTSFPHNTSDSEAIETLNSIYGQLNNGGIAVIDNGYSDLLFREKPKLIPAREAGTNAFYFFLEYPDSQRVIFNILSVGKTPAGFENAFDSIEYMAIGKARFEGFFSNTPFERVEYYGDYSFSPYSTETSKRMVVIAQK